MLALTATAEARSQLRALKTDNPGLFELVVDRIYKVRDDPGGKNAGRTFMLPTGRLARLATFYDAQSGGDLSLVWVIEDDDESQAVKIVWAAVFDEDETEGPPDLARP